MGGGRGAGRNGLAGLKAETQTVCSPSLLGASHARAGRCKQAWHLSTDEWIKEMGSALQQGVTHPQGETK